ncbi:MAG: hypothetical protein PHQ47_02480 [Candidatus Portnoybacteria bacterium]|nr:hypothetical protein [Candidatus Portnoybacteria bacterium]
MGAPNKRFPERKELKRLNLAEKLRLFIFGKETANGLNIGRFSDVLEEVKKIILPLVFWLDKPFKEFIHADEPPQSLQNKRAMFLYDGFFLKVWLERSGKWILRIRKDNSKDKFQIADSSQFAEILCKNAEELLKRSLAYKNGSKDEIPFFIEIILYHSLFSYLLSQFAKEISKSLEEREEKLAIMRQRKNFLDEFIVCLDPLANGEKEIVLKEFAIQENLSGGRIHWHHQGYLCLGAVERLLKVGKSRHPGDGYEIKTTTLCPDSLKNFLDWILNKASDIKEARRRDCVSPETLWGYNTGRLPFTEEELEILSAAVEQIKRKN